MQVRHAARHDLQGLAALLGQLGYPAEPDQLERRLERLDGELFVAADDEPVGLAALQIMHVLQRDAPSARLTALVVREDARAAYRALGFEDTGRRYAKRL